MWHSCWRDIPLISWWDALWAADTTFSTLRMWHFKLCFNLLTRGFIARPSQVNVISLKNARFKPLFHSLFAFPLTVHLLCNFCDSCALPLHESSRLFNFQPQRYGFSTPIPLALYCIDLITSWACLFLLHFSVLPLSSAFSFFPLFWISRVGRVFLGFLFLFMS